MVHFLLMKAWCTLLSALMFSVIYVFMPSLNKISYLIRNYGSLGFGYIFKYRFLGLKKKRNPPFLSNCPK